MTATITREDVAALDRSEDVVMNAVARDCSQPGCRWHAAWMVRDRARTRYVPLCTRDASRRIRRRALPRRWAR